MKNKLKNKRGGAFALAVTCFLFLFIALFAPVTARADFVLLNGNTVTNANAAYNAFMGATGITNNYQVGQVPGASNVLNYLSTTPGAQPAKGTNGYLPAFVYNAQGSFPNSASRGPTRTVSFEINGSLMATNASATAIVFRFAGSDSGLNWQTNWQTFTLTIPVNSTTLTASNCILTSVDAGGTGYIALQQIDNPGVSALTNITICIAGKTGL